MRRRRLTIRWVAVVAACVATHMGATGASAGVQPGSLTLFTNASSSVALGGAIHDTATLLGASSPTGTLTFSAYGPDDATCAGPPAFTTTEPVAGNGIYDSDPFTPTAAGVYRWVATYSGDANNPPVSSPCNDPFEEVSVLSLTTDASPSVPVGGTISDTATLLGGRSPTGTIRFDLYGPDNPTCAGPPVFTSTRNVSGNGSVTSAGFTPTVPGTYRWRARYSGDGDNAAVGPTACDDPNESVVVTPPQTPIGVFRPSNSTWYIQGGPVEAFGTTGDIQVPGDYDGDGTTDIAVFRPSSGIWFVRGGPTVQFGASGDIPVPADYDGDGDDDIAVFRPSSGIWFVQGGPTVQFGTSGDIPVPADYDGDGDDDIAVFRPSSGIWFVQGGPAVQFGTAGDRPLPLPYAVQNVFFP